VERFGIVNIYIFVYMFKLLLGEKLVGYWINNQVIIISNQLED